MAQLSELESARLMLARASHLDDPELQRSLLQAIRVAAVTLNVARVGVWCIDPTWSKVRCVAMYERSSELLSSGVTLELAHFPRYAAALKERRVIAADDAPSDPRTSELVDSYLGPNAIAALLDCPVYENGEVVAIVCHEHVGSARQWTKRDADFAVYVAEIVSTLFVQSARLRSERELRETREALAEARVMDSLGRMAARVAHDFNNVLSGVSLGLMVVEQEPALTAGARAAISDSNDLVQQGARLVKQLLAFARPGADEGQVVDLAASIRDMLPRLQRLLGNDIVLLSTLPDECLLVALELSSVEQIVMNLVLNARDALAGGGTIELSVAASRENVTLRVRDTGVGMDAATRQRIFEPFFSTKGERGSGLGLAIVFGAVRRAGGTISAESELGAGATFTLEFPRA